jgi:hypothetical protein
VNHRPLITYESFQQYREYNHDTFIQDMKIKLEMKQKTSTAEVDKLKRELQV